MVGYDAPPENFQASLQKMVDGVGTFKALSAAYAKNPKDAATAFKLARKWSDRYDAKKAAEKYKEVLALDPQGKAGTYTQEYSGITAPYTEFAAFELLSGDSPMAKPDAAAVKAFIAKYPKSPLIKSAYQNMGYYYGYQATKEEAASFFAEYIGRYPNDPDALYSWLNRIIRDKGPADKAVELAAKLEDATKFNPSPSYNQALAQAYVLKGDKAKADKLYGKDFIENKVSSFGYDLIGWASYQAENGGDMDAAIKMGETALKLEPDSSYFLGQVAGLYVKANQLPKALQLYGPAYSRKNEKDGTALWQYAGFWARQEKNLDDALVAAKKAVGLMPTYYIYNTLSQVYQKMKNTPEAIKAAEKALELAPETAKTFYKQALDKLKNPAPPAPDKK